MNMQGFGWGTVASVITLLVLGYLTERIGFIRRPLNEDPIIFFEDGNLHKALMRKHMVDENDLSDAGNTGKPQHGEKPFMACCRIDRVQDQADWSQKQCCARCEK